jgi:hypothetical protein
MDKDMDLGDLLSWINKILSENLSYVTDDVIVSLGDRYGKRLQNAVLEIDNAGNRIVVMEFEG